MEHFLNPEPGMMIWTMVVFVLLVTVVSKFAWGPIVKTLSEREEGIRKAIDDAAAARQEADALRMKLEKELAESQSRIQALMKESQADAQKLRDQIVKDAHADAQRLTEQTKKQLDEEKARLVRELRQEISGLSVSVAEKLLRRVMNAKEQEALVQEILNELDREKARHN